MRALWCCLLVLFVLAPAGTVGITAAPSDAETAIAAPRTSSTASARKLVDEPTPDPVAVAIAPSVRAQRVAEGCVARLAPSSQTIVETVCVASAGPRAPPA